MAEKVFNISEIAGTSDESVERAIARARQMSNLEWFKVEEVRGAISGDSIEYLVPAIRV